MSSPDRQNRRKTQIGFVSSKMGDKSVKVTVPYKTPHPLYHKVINRKTVLHVHDEKNETKVGDKIEVMETRPISRLKRWRVTRIVEASVGAQVAAVSEQDVAEAVPTKTRKENPPAAPAQA
ncbi:MAG TPA: 30S ribosomal protein S17 [Lacunisphaera sp.]|nr:30S ribosomal protein S17 [Lacunisphaera sp.]